MHQITFHKLDNIPRNTMITIRIYLLTRCDDFSMNQPGMEMGKSREDQSGAGEQSHTHSHAHSHTPPYQADQEQKQKKGETQTTSDKYDGEITK